MIHDTDTEDARPVLTPREQEIATCIFSFLTNKEIGTKLGISERTVEQHIENINAKLPREPGMRPKSRIFRWELRGY